MFGNWILDKIASGVKSKIAEVVFNKCLGQFVKDFDISQINLELYKGALELSNLQLKEDTINSFLEKTPLSFKEGKIIKISIVIPWDDIANKNTTLTIENIEFFFTLKESFFQNEGQMNISSLYTSFSESIMIEKNENDLITSSLFIGDVSKEEYSNIDPLTGEKNEGGEKTPDDDDYVARVLERLLSNFKIIIKNLNIKIELLPHVILFIEIPSFNYSDETPKLSNTNTNTNTNRNNWSPSFFKYCFSFKEGIILKLFKNNEILLLQGEGKIDELLATLYPNENEEILKLDCQISLLHLLIDQKNFNILIEIFIQLQKKLFDKNDNTKNDDERIRDGLGRVVIDTSHISSIPINGKNDEDLFKSFELTKSQIEQDMKNEKGNKSKSRSTNNFRLIEEEILEDEGNEFSDNEEDEETSLFHTIYSDNEEEEMNNQINQSKTNFEEQEEEKRNKEDKNVPMTMKLNMKIKKTMVDILYDDDKDSGKKKKWIKEKEGIEIISDHLHFLIDSVSFNFENNERKSVIELSIFNILLCENLVTNSRLIQSNILKFKENCLRFEMNYFKGNKQINSSLILKPISISINFETLHRVFAFYESINKEIKRDYKEDESEKEFISSMHSLNEFESFILKKDDSDKLNASFYISIDGIEILLTLPNYENQLFLTLNSLKFETISFYEVKGEIKDISVFLLQPNNEKSLILKVNPSDLNIVLKEINNKIKRNKNVVTSSLEKIEINNKLNEKMKKDREFDNEEVEFEDFDEEDFDEVEKDAFEMEEVIDRTIRDKRIFNSAETAIQFSAPKIFITISEKRFLILQDFIQQVLTNINQILKVENNTKSPKFYQKAMDFLYVNVDTTKNIIPKMALHLQINELDVKLDSENDEKTFHISVKDLETFVMLYFNPILILKLHLKSEEFFLKGDGRYILRGTKKLVKEFRNNRDCIIVEVLFKKDDYLNMTNTLVKTQLNGIYMNIYKSYDWVKPLSKYVDLGEVTTDDSMSCIYIMLQDCTVDYSPENRTERLLVSVNCLKVSAKLIQTSDNMKINLNLSDLNVLLHDNCKLNLVNEYIREKEKIFGFINNLIKLGFVRIGSVNRLMIGLRKLNDSGTPTKEKPPIKVVCENGIINIGCCADSIKLLSIVLNTLINKVPSSTTNEVKEQPEIKKESSEIYSSSGSGYLESDPELSPESPLMERIIDITDEVELVNPSKNTFKKNANILKYKDATVVIHPHFFTMKIKEDYLSLPTSIVSTPKLSKRFPIPEIEILLHNDTNVIIQMFDGRDFAKIDEDDYNPRDISASVEIKIEDIFFRMDLFKEISEYVFMTKLSLKNFQMIDKLKSSSRNLMLSYLVTKFPRVEGSNIIDLHLDCQRLFENENIFNFKLNILPLRINLHQKALYFLMYYMSNIIGGDDDDKKKKDKEKGKEDKKGGKKKENNDDDNTIKFKTFEIGNILCKIDYQGSREINYSVISKNGNNWKNKFADLALNLISVKEAKIFCKKIRLKNVDNLEKLVQKLTSHYIHELKPSKLFGIFLGLLPVKRFYNVGSGVADIFIIPVKEIYKDEGYLLRGIKKGLASFGKSLAKESIGLSASVSGGISHYIKTLSHKIANKLDSSISRNRHMPENVKEGAQEAVTSVKRGFSDTYYAFVAIPKAYQEKGSIGIANTAMKAIPLGILSPISGISDAISKLLYGVQNKYFPFLKEEHDRIYKNGKK